MDRTCARPTNCAARARLSGDCSSTAIPHMAKAAVGDLHYGLNGTFRRVPRRAKPCRAVLCLVHGLL